MSVHKGECKVDEHCVDESNKSVEPFPVNGLHNHKTHRAIHEAN